MPASAFGTGARGRLGDLVPFLTSARRGLTARSPCLLQRALNCEVIQGSFLFLKHAIFFVVVIVGIISEPAPLFHLEAWCQSMRLQQQPKSCTRACVPAGACRRYRRNPRVAQRERASVGRHAGERAAYCGAGDCIHRPDRRRARRGAASPRKPLHFSLFALPPSS